MSKDPAFLFYPGDWLGGTHGMTFEQKGAYIELLMMQFNRGHMTIDMIDQTIGNLWEKVKDKFEVDKDGKYFNKRLEHEKESRKKWTESRRNNLKGKNQYSKNINRGHMTNHMENENRNDNEYTNINVSIPFILSKDQKTERATLIYSEICKDEEFPKLISKGINRIITPKDIEHSLKRFLNEVIAKDEIGKSLKEIKIWFINTTKKKGYE